MVAFLDPVFSHLATTLDRGTDRPDHRLCRWRSFDHVASTMVITLIATLAHLSLYELPLMWLGKRLTASASTR